MLLEHMRRQSPMALSPTGLAAAALPLALMNPEPNHLFDALSAPLSTAATPPRRIPAATRRSARSRTRVLSITELSPHSSPPPVRSTPAVRYQLRLRELTATTELTPPDLWLASPAPVSSLDPFGDSGGDTSPASICGAPPPDENALPPEHVASESALLAQAKKRKRSSARGAGERKGRTRRSAIENGTESLVQSEGLGFDK